MKKINPESVQNFLKACDIAGEEAVNLVLTELNIHDKKLLTFIKTVTLKSFNISLKYYNSPQTNPIDCKTFLAYFYKKYLNYKYSDIGFELGIKHKSSVYTYLLNVKSLDENIPYQRDLLKQLSDIESKIEKFIKTLSHE